MMDQENVVKSRLESYKFFSYLFLALPDENFVKSILNLNETSVEQDCEGFDLIRSYIVKNESKSTEEVLIELSVDRTQLLRGLTMDGARPPYESLYLGKAPEEVLGELNGMYNQIQHAIATEVYESPEQIGVELNFMQILCEKKQEAIFDHNESELQNLRRIQQEFLRRHLGQWASQYADEMVNHARTDFYKGIALLLKDFMREELTSFQLSTDCI